MIRILVIVHPIHALLYSITCLVCIGTTYVIGLGDRWRYGIFATIIIVFALLGIQIVELKRG